MPNGHLDIGNGVGEASVWNPMVPVQNFNNMLLQKKAQQKAEADAIASELGKVKSDGLRNDADRQHFLSEYEKIKNNAIASAGERNSMKKALARAQTRDALMGLQQYVDQSKQQGQLERSVSSKLIDPTQRHNYTDDSVTQMLGNMKLAVNDPKYDKSLSGLQRQVDHNKIDEAVRKMHQENLNKVPWSNPIQDGGTITQGDKKGVITYQNRALAPEQILANDAHLYDVNDDLKQSLEQRYGAIKGETPAETKMLRIKQAAIDRGDLAQGSNGELMSNIKGEQNRKFNPNRAPDNYYNHYFFREGQNASKDLQTPAQTLIAGDPSRGIAGMQQGGVGTGEKFVGLAPPAQYGGKKPTIGVDPNTGEHIFTFPAQIGGKDANAVKYNDAIREKYKKSPEKTGGILGFGGENVPFEKSKAYKELKPETIYKKPEQVYKLNPASPEYLARIAEVAKEQNINLDQLNKIEAKKGTRGQIQQAVNDTGVNPVNKHKKAATDYGL